MNRHADPPPEKAAPRKPATGKSHYADLQRRLADLQRFRELLDYANDAIFILHTASGRLVDVNEAACQLLLHDRPALLGVSFEDFVPPEVAEALSAGAAEAICTTLRRRDDTTVPVEITLGRVVIEDAVFATIVARDITERERAERALRESEERWQFALEGAGDGVWDWNLQTNDVFFSKQWKAMLGYEEHELAHRLEEWDKLVHPEDKERAYADIRRHLAGETPVYVCEHRLRCKDGTYKWILDRGKLVSHAPDGKPLRMIGTHADITDRKRAEAALNDMAREWQATFDAVNDVVWLLGPDDRILRCNKATQTILGKDPKEVLGKTCDEVLRRSDLSLPECPVKCMRASGRRESQELRVGDRWVVVTADPVLDDKGATIAVVHVIRDITQQVNMADERRRIEARMEQARKLESLGVLAGGIAHDFNNVLMAILGNAELALLELPGDSPACEMLAAIEQGVHQAAELCRQMLAYSGQGQFVIQALDLSRMIEELESTIQGTLARPMVFRKELEHGLPPVEADAGQVRQLIVNLVTNAAEAIGDGGGTVTLKTGSMECDRAFLSESQAGDEAQAGRYVFLEVEDTGCGMDPETLQRIFDPFFTTKFIGRGLGLPAVLGIVRSHKGVVRVSSEPGKGTLVRVLFPAKMEARIPAPIEAEAHWRGEGTILIADDDPSVRAICARMIERLGFEVLTAADGVEAVRLFREHHERIKGVLLDLTMPWMDGEETFRALHEIAPDVRVIISSGYGEQDVAARFADHNPAGFIQKPYRTANLAAVFQAALQR